MMVYQTPVYYRLAGIEPSGKYVWISVAYNHLQPIVTYARLKGAAGDELVFAATDLDKLRTYLERYNRGQPSVCLPLHAVARGVRFAVSDMEKQVEEAQMQQEEKEWSELVPRLLFMEYLMLEKGLFNEWGVPDPTGDWTLP